MNEQLFYEEVIGVEGSIDRMCEILKKDKYYFGLVYIICSDIATFHKYAHLIEKYKCDVIVIGDNSRARSGGNFRPLYDKIPAIGSIINLSLGFNNYELDLDWDILDITKFYNLQSLCLFGIAKIRDIDFSALTNLQRLDCDYINVNHGWMKNDNLKYLRIINFNEKTVNNLLNNKNLKRLEIQSTSIKSLSGLEQLQQVETLVIKVARSLTDFQALLSMPNLKHIWFEYYIKNTDWNFLKKMPQLRSICIPKANDVYFINEMPNLEVFAVEKILNKDQRPIDVHPNLIRHNGREIGERFRV